MDGKLNILFNTNIEGEITNISDYTMTNKVPPCLVINNKSEFDECLIEYVEKARDFYDQMDIKLILGMLFADAGGEDFTNPIRYIRRKIDFMEDKTLDNYYDQRVNIGYSNILDDNVYCTLKKENIFNETPYSLVFRLFDKGYYEFPTVRLGLQGDTAYIYAVQNERKRSGRDFDETSYQKRINRKLYKIGEVPTNEDEDESLNDITASFLIVLNMTMALLENKGIKKIVAPYFRSVRYNSKIRVSELKVKNDKTKELKLEDLIEENDLLQRNISDKYIRTFLRLCYENKGLVVSAYPFDCDDALHIENNGYEGCNNKLLDDTYNMIINNKERSL